MRWVVLPVVLAVVAGGSSSAFASEAVQVVSEDSGLVCGSLSGGGGCAVHLVGTVALRVDLVFFEVNEATCNLEVEMRIAGSGAGAIDGVEHNTGPDANCATVVSECALPWLTSGEEDGPVGVVQSQATVCIDPAESDINCVGALAFDVVEGSAEHLTYEKQGGNGIGPCELDFDLEVEHEGSTWNFVHVNHP